MNEIQSNLKYSASHEWARLEKEGSVTVGISDHAQALLGDLVFVELPVVGDHKAAKAECAVVESVKAASDVYMPIAGKILAVNEDLNDSPADVNESPYDKGWIFRMQPDNVADLQTLLDSEAYAAQLAEKE